MPKWGILHGDKTGAWVVVMIAQLVYRLLLPLEGPGSNPVIGKFSINIVKRTENTKIKLSNHRIPGKGGGRIVSCRHGGQQQEEREDCQLFCQKLSKFSSDAKNSFRISLSSY